MPNPSQEPQISSKAPSQDLEETDALCSTENYTDLTELEPLKNKQDLHQTRTKSKPKQN